MYDTLEQASLRLNGTVILIGGTPAYVAEVRHDREGKIILVYFNSSDRNAVPKEIEANDPSVDPRNMRLGYVNDRRHTYFLARTPARQQAQGLNRRNVYTYTPGTEEPMGNMFEDLRRNGSLYKALRGEYPTIEQCAEQLNAYDSEIVSRAFHRHFALVRNDNFDFLELHYKNERIGYGDLNNFTLPSRYSYLTEMIKQSGVITK